MRALVDADILCYEYGNFKDTDSGQLMAWEIVRGLVDGRIAAILEAVGATSQSFYLTDSVSNFRMEVATIVPYKGKRPKAKPPHWALIREHLIDNYDAEVCYGIEADDKVGIEQSINFNSVVKAAAEDDNLGCYWKGVERYCDTIICSRDKDLHMIAGWHYSWQCGKQKERKWYTDETDGIRFFYKQLLTGDSTDNILGLFGVGEKSTLVSALDDMTDEPDMYAHVHSKYEDRFGSYSFQFMEENARLLWICRGIFGETPADEALCYMEIMKSKYDRRTHDGEENS